MVISLSESDGSLHPPDRTAAIDRCRQDLRRDLGDPEATILEQAAAPPARFGDAAWLVTLRAPAAPLGPRAAARAACGGAAQVPAVKVVRQPHFTFEAPAGRERMKVDTETGAMTRLEPEDSPPERHGLAESAPYVAGDGSHVYVEHGSGPLDGQRDAVWQLARKGDRVQIAKEGPRCRAKDDPTATACPCPVGNGRLDINGRFSDPAPGLHLAFGNRVRETGVDLEPFRRIIRSLRVR